MTYKPFKMRSSPMKRNFGIGEKEEASPTKGIGNILGASIQAGLDAGAGTSYGKDKEAKAAAEKARLQKEKDKDTQLQRQKDLFEHQSKISKANKTKGPVEGDLNGDGKVDEEDTKLQEESADAGAGAADAADDGAGNDAGSGTEYNPKKRKKTPGKLLGGLMPKLPGLGK